MINDIIASNKIEFVIFAELHHVANECQNKKQFKVVVVILISPFLSVEEFLFFHVVLKSVYEITFFSL